MKRILLIVLCVLLLPCCETVRYVQPQLPEMTLAVPERPTLLEVSEEVPVEATINLIYLTSYAEKLELVINAWEVFYRGLREGETNELDYNRN